MSTAIVIGILIAAGAGHGPGTAALLASLTEAMGSGPSIVVEDTVGPSDSDVLRMEQQLHAGAVVVIEDLGASTSTHVRIHVVRGDRWIDRRINFVPGDTIVERGRAVGLTVASVLLVETTVLPQSNGGTGQPLPPQVVAAPTIGKPSDATTAVARGDRESPAAERYAVDLGVVGSSGLSGPAAGIGGASHFEFALTDAIWPRIGGGGRIGPVAGLDGKDVALWVTVGGAWNPIRARKVGQFGLATYLDAGILFHDLSHATATGTTLHDIKALPAASLTVQGRWRVAPRFELTAALGAEFVLGSTDVWVATRRVATLPWVRGLATIGVRFGW